MQKPCLLVTIRIVNFVKDANLQPWRHTKVESFENTILAWALLAIRFLLQDLRSLYLIGKTKCLENINYCLERLASMQSLALIQSFLILIRSEILLIFLQQILRLSFFYCIRVDLISCHWVTELIHFLSFRLKLLSFLSKSYHFRLCIG